MSLLLALISFPSRQKICYKTVSLLYIFCSFYRNGPSDRKKLDLHQAFYEGFLETFTMHEHVLIVIFACMILHYHYRFTLCLKKQRTTIKNTFSKLRPSWFVRHPWFNNGDHGVHSRCSCFRIFLSTKHKVLEVCLRKCEEESCKQFGNSPGRK